ncbi:7-cyano-7-deazaguanine synthase [Dissostichus eleginoides]|uniref:7-cyano-7-deazaguanine synthase n=1 Tax=Dissostichus eleginoides TaxID=100907 RepID=A0AAD9B647_DISEL|nr:7-cyano-7-deazaguanine synthase [Dissostichus eleginoides]
MHSNLILKFVQYYDFFALSGATSSGLKAKLIPRGNSQEKPSDLTWSCEVQQSHACQAYTACLVQRPAMICGGLRGRFHTTLLPKHPHCLPNKPEREQTELKVILYNIYT